MTDHKHSSYSLHRHFQGRRLPPFVLAGSLLLAPIMAYGVGDGAQAEGEETHAHERHRAHSHRHGHPAGHFPRYMVSAADSDQDGKVSSEEWSAALAATDTDGDGLLSHEELDARRQALRAEAERVGGDGERRRFAMHHRIGPDEEGLKVADLEARFEHLDRNGDGFITREDRPERRAERRRGRRGGPVRGLLHQADTNDDRALSEEEWTGFLATADSDSDGTLSLDELEALRPADAPDHGAEGDDRPGLEVSRLNDMFQKLDRDDNGIIEGHEWHRTGRRGRHHRGERSGSGQSNTGSN